MMTTLFDRTSTSIVFHPDILGSDFGQHTFDLGQDPDRENKKRIYSTLVKHLAAPHDAHHAILYVHGFSDYFFQQHVAEFFAQQGYAFYALDLHKCGRSLRQGQSAHYATNLQSYDKELDLAVEAIANDSGLPIITMGHSLGGLIVPLWLNRRQKTRRIDPIVGFILNSPLLDTFPRFKSRSLKAKLLTAVGKISGTSPIGLVDHTVYDTATNIKKQGEWSYNERWKPAHGVQMRAGLLKALDRGHQQLHRGLDLSLPGLVLRSAHSYQGSHYNQEAAHADSVLDPQGIARWAGCVTHRITSVPIQGALHDVFLSNQSARDHAFAELGFWLDREIYHAGR